MMVQCHRLTQFKRTGLMRRYRGNIETVQTNLVRPPRPYYLTREGVNVDIVSTRFGLEMVQERIFAQGTKERLRYFRPQVNIDDERRIGSHARICVSDSEHAHIGSANLTMPGLNMHFEIGLLVHGEVVRQISDFWKLLMDRGLLVES